MPYEEYIKLYPRKLSLIQWGGEWWIQSQFTGEIVKPYDFRGIWTMIRDMFRKW